MPPGKSFRSRPAPSPKSLPLGYGKRSPFSDKSGPTALPQPPHTGMRRAYPREKRPLSGLTADDGGERAEHEDERRDLRPARPLAQEQDAAQHADDRDDQHADGEN